jgi:VCBS repeat-containing protein
MIFRKQALSSMQQDFAMGTKLNLFQLEQRQLFDGAALVAGIHPDGSNDGHLADATTNDVRAGLEARFASERDGIRGGINTPALKVAESKRELLVIDSSVKDWTSLTSNLGAKVDVLLLDADKDGLQQIADQLLSHNDKDQQRYSSLHILSHGDVGIIQLGNRAIDAQTVADRHSEFAQLGESLEAGADVLLYGCDVGSNARGINFLKTLADATQRDVAASTNKTGGTSAGGDWKLEATVGEVAASTSVGSALLEDVSYQYLLPTNQAPIAVDDARIISGNQTINDGQALIGNTFGDSADSDPDGEGFTVAGIRAGDFPSPFVSGESLDSPIQGQWGSIQINGLGLYTYTPNAAAIDLPAGQYRTDVFTYTICDPQGAVDTATISIGIYGVKPIVNLPPVAVADVRTLCESEVINDGQAVKGNLFGDQADSDPEGEGFIVSGVTLGDVSQGTAVSGGVGSPIVGQFGTLVLGSDGSYTYTPNANAIALYQGQSGRDVFTYTICDNGNLTSNTTISITVCGEGLPPPVNRPPVANNDVREICEDDLLTNGQAIRGNAQGDARDTDPEGDALKIAGVGSKDSTGNLTGNVGTALAGQWGSITISSDGSYSYTPNAAAQSLQDGQKVSDVFRYTVCDTAGLLSTASITINLCGVNDGPVARSDTRTICEDDTLNDGKAIAGNLNGDVADSDPDGDALKVQGITLGDSGSASITGGVGTAIAGTWGSITIDRTGNYIYQPNAAAQSLSDGETVKDVFTYTICDPSGAVSTAKITIEVCGQNDAPIAKDDVRTTTPSTTISNGGAITGNTFGDTKDGDPDRNDVLTVVGVRPGTEDPNCLPAATGGIRASTAEQANVNKPIEGTYGSLTLKPDGTYTYQPNAAAQNLLQGQKVQDVFTYMVSDGKSGSDCAQITIRMEGTKTAPPVVVPPVVVPPIVVPPVVVPPTVTPPVVEATPLVPLVVLPPGRTATSSTLVNAVPIVAPLFLSRPQLTLGSAVIPEQAGALVASPFGETPRVVKGFVEEAPPAKEDCVPVQKAAVKPGDKVVAKVKPKIRPSIFTGAVEKPNKSFSEQVQTAAKRFKIPAKVAPRIVEKEC